MEAGETSKMKLPGQNGTYEQSWEIDDRAEQESVGDYRQMTMVVNHQRQHSQVTCHRQSSNVSPELKTVKISLA